MTATICSFNIITLIIDLFFFIPYSTRKEKAMGTVRYIIYFLLASALTQLTYALLMFLLSFLEPSLISVPSFGLLPLFFAETVADCFRQPEAVQR